MLQGLKEEDDRGIIYVNGEAIEMAELRTWKSAVNGFWDVATNWTNDRPPLTGDIVTISFPLANITTTYRSGNLAIDNLISDEALVLSGGSLTVNAIGVNNTLTLSGGTLTVNGTGASTIDNLTQSNGTLNGTGEVLVKTNFNWTGGWQSGTGKTTIKGTANLNGSSRYLDTRTVENQGTVTWSAGDIYLYNGATWDNTSIGILDIQGNNSFSYQSGSQPKLVNAGTVRKSAGTGTTSITTRFDNTGTVRVSSGTLNLSGGGSSSGNWSVSNGATLQFGSNYSLQGGTLAGTGTVIGNLANLTRIDPGDGIGQLNITGNYTQTSAAILNIELGEVIASIA